MFSKFKTLEIDGIRAEISWKKIKNCYIRILPPDGRVHISAPQRMSNKTVKALFVDRLEWIRAKQKDLQQQPAPLPLQYLDGEEHCFLGQPYILQLQHSYRKRQPIISGNYLIIFLRTQGTNEQREQVLGQWYRQELEKMIPPLLKKWEPILKVHANEWRIRKMKTRWGTCNTVAKRIWINLELAKRPYECIEYVLVHELIHLLEPSHNKRFYDLMDHFLPGWQKQRKMLR